MTDWLERAMARAAVILGGGCGQHKVQLLQEHLVFPCRLGVAAQDQCAVVGCGEMDVEHLNFGHLIEHGPRRQSRRQCFEPYS
jgi:hypothetical protein